MPHSSGSWSLLRDDVKNFKRLTKFEDVEAHNLYFEVSAGNDQKRIENEFQFNTLMKLTKESNGIHTLPELKVQIQGKILSRLGMKSGINILQFLQLMIGKKPYSNWDIKEAFIKVLDEEYTSLNDYPTFNLEKLPDHNPISETELKPFVEEIEKTLRVFKKPLILMKRLVNIFLFL